MAWWGWVLLGLGLLAAEIAVPGGLFALFFGAGALLVGVLAAVGLGGPDWLQWLLFTAVSVALLVTLRGRLRRPAAGARTVDTLVGEGAVLLDDLPPGGVSRAELRGTSWTARSRSPLPLLRGARCKVERVDGLTLWLIPE
ncbi:MAG TPA: NfeD family protein [Anaeromyxobacteraceae bacterium]|nr:NfeD family protein [Anaeromyxobacteraceae bacterium]HET9595664.1 NfeD family protein [Anaeromyxobacteraceae bacterium]